MDEFPHCFGKGLEYQIFWKSFYCETTSSMRVGERTDGQIYGQPLQTKQSLQKCAKRLILFYFVTYFYKTRTYLCLNGVNRVWKCCTDRSQLLLCSRNQSTLLQKWHELMLLCTGVRYNINLGVTFARQRETA